MLHRRLSLKVAIALSLALHAASLAAASVRHATLAANGEHANEVDNWAATSVEVGTETAVSAAESQTPARAHESAEQAEPEPSSLHVEDAASAEAIAPRERQPKPTHAPRPARERPTPPRASPPEKPKRTSAAREGTSASVPEAAAQSSLPSGSLGALGLPPGVRHFGRAFTRALPEGSYRDPAWSELPPGFVGKAVFKIQIDTEGHIASTEFDEKIATPPIVKRMIEHALLLLRAGTFSLDARSVSEGIERLALEVSVRDEPAPNADAAPRELFAENNEPPSANRPGFARFTLNSGRHMEAIVKELSAR